MTEIPDPLAALRAFLKADPDVNAITQGRIFAGEITRTVADSMPLELVLLSYGGGGGAIGNAYQQYGDVRVDALCYGATPEGGDAVWRRVQPALKQMRREVQLGCLLHWARKGGGPLALRDPDTDWPSTFSSWQVLVAEVAVV